MKILLLLLVTLSLLLPVSLHAGDPTQNVAFTDAKGTWVWKGQKWKGQVHKYVDGKIYVTADVSNYAGMWLDAAQLDAASRGWLGIGTAADDAAYAAWAAREQQALDTAHQQRIADAVAADEAAKAKLAFLQRQRDQAAAAKSADLAEKQRAFDNYLHLLEVQALQRIANKR